MLIVVTVEHPKDEIEAVWGADPLERYGGFSKIPYDLNQTYPGSLAPNASVKWQEAQFETSQTESGALVKLLVEHHDIAWAFQVGIYGWAALQYQTWIRGTLLNADSFPIRISLFPTNILELRINGQHYFGGDLFGFERAPIIVSLVPGNNTIEVRMIREVRANGGSLPPRIEASLRAAAVSQQATILENTLVLPDVVDGSFVSSSASAAVANTGDEWLSIDTVIIESKGVRQMTNCSIKLAPGQSRPVNFCVDNIQPSERDTTLLIHCSTSQKKPRVLEKSIAIVHVGRHDPQKFTFLHPSGAVSYAIIRPPSKKVIENAKTTLPVLVALHGAGLEADSDMVRNSFSADPDLSGWLLLPHGMSSWSGDDWHIWGAADVHAALQAIPYWINSTSWRGPGVFTERYVVAGHSNGGQGAWYLALHHPDRVTAAAAASGYSSIENYVPYVMWGCCDSLQEAVLQSARNSHKHELYLSNMAHTPTLIQHGELDDNVPVHHGRLMHTLAVREGVDASYVEVPGRGHWWDDVMVTDPMRQFYDEHLKLQPSPEPPNSFSCVFGNSHEFGSCMGIVVDQLVSPDALGRIHVEVKTSGSRRVWHIGTSNIRRLSFEFNLSKLAVALPDSLTIDSRPAEFNQEDKSCGTYTRLDCGEWTSEDSRSWRTLDQRVGDQRGPMNAILKTRGPFQIVYASEEAFDVALEISRNLLQYYGAAADLLPVTEYENALRSDGNIFLVQAGGSVDAGQLTKFPLQINDGNIEVRSQQGSRNYATEAGIGAAWLRPLPNERLELVIWGFDDAGLKKAARMTPTLTGAGQPDFVIFDQNSGWEGAAGTFAIGFFDHSWNISAGSYLR